MASEGLAAAGAGEGLLANPWFLAGLAGLLLGFSAGGAVRCLIEARRGGRTAVRSVLVLVTASAAILSAAALLVFPAKAEALSQAVLLWAAGLAAAGLVVGIFPRAGGLSFVALGLCCAAFLADAVSGWTPLSAPSEVARLLPLSESNGLWAVEFSSSAAKGRMSARHLELRSAEAALWIERLDLPGPAAIAGPASFYRITALADGKGGQLLAFEPRTSLLDRLSRLPREGAYPSQGRLLRRSRELGPALPLVALEPMVFGFRPAHGGGPPVAVAESDPAPAP